MTDEQFITLETAKLLKKAGFDWECRYYYDTWASPTLFDDRTGELQYELRTGTMGTDIVPKNYNERPDGAFASAPTQAVAQRWLREVKNCEVVVDIDLRIAHCYEPMLGIVNRYATDNMPAVVWKRIDDARKYPTYEAALETGLQKCLTLINEE